MKKIIKFVICIIMIIAILILNTNSVTASSLGDIINSGSNFINSGANTNAIVPNEEGIRDTSNFIFNIVFTLGIIILIIWGMVLGIKFITGSVEEQADVKKGLFPYGVGCIIIFSGYAIWRIVVIIASKIA